jgi:phosphoglucosamine mutase
MINVPLLRRIDVATSPPVQAAVREAEVILNGRGRVLLRPSGTEPLIRVMVEGQDEILVRERAQLLAAVVAQAVEARADAG